MKQTSILTLVSILCAVASMAPAIEIPLTFVNYKEFPKEDSTYYPVGAQLLDISMTPPAGDWKLPAFNASQPIYAFIALGEEKRLIIFDKKDKADVFYGRLYVDANTNNDLTDDPPIDGESNKEDQFSSARFPAVDTNIRINGRSFPYSFTLEANRFEEPGRSFKESSCFILKTNCVYQGRFELDGNTYTCWLSDANADGRFDNFVETQDLPDLPGGDRLYLADQPSIKQFNKTVLSDHLVLVDKLFRVSVNIAENNMTFMPVTTATAKINVPVRSEHLTLHTVDKASVIVMYRPAEEAPIPPGDYRLMDYLINRKDEKGDEWIIEAKGTNDTPTFAVTESEAPALTFGEPYVPTVVAKLKPRETLGQMGIPEPQYHAQNTETAELAFVVHGVAKEKVSNLARVSGRKSAIPISPKNTQRPKEPIYKIVNPAGELVTQGQFEYG